MRARTVCFASPIYTGLGTMYACPALVTGEWLAILARAIAVFAYWRKIRLVETSNATHVFGFVRPGSAGGRSRRCS